MYVREVSRVVSKTRVTPHSVTIVLNLINKNITKNCKKSVSTVPISDHTIQVFIEKVFLTKGCAACAYI